MYETFDLEAKYYHQAKSSKHLLKVLATLICRFVDTVFSINLAEQVVFISLYPIIDFLFPSAEVYINSTSMRKQANKESGSDMEVTPIDLY